MHMESVQRYVLNMTEQEARDLYNEMRGIASGVYFDRPNLLELYETLEVWFGFDKNQ